MPDSIDGISIIKKNYKGRSMLAIGGSESIALNTSRKSAAIWKNIGEYQKKAFESGFNSSSNPNHVILHELAHVKVKKFGGTTLNSKLSNLNSNDIYFKKMSEKVSKYAGKNGHEFVAEVYAGTRSGIVFPKEIMDYYKFIGGPEI